MTPRSSKIARSWFVELRGRGHDGLALHTAPQNDLTRRVQPDDAAAVLIKINSENRDIHG
jgi:hypothetical protein